MIDLLGRLNEEGVVYAEVRLCPALGLVYAVVPRWGCVLLFTLWRDWRSSRWVKVGKLDWRCLIFRCSSSNSLHRGEDVSPSDVGRPEISKNVVRDSREGMDREIKKVKEKYTKWYYVHNCLWGFYITYKLQVKEGAETQQMLVEKIVGLQRACARRQEKLDFLEEHVEQVFLGSRSLLKLMPTHRFSC